MKLLLLKTLLQRRARDEGFTLPMVIALGLVMLLLGAVSITIANEENITAISQNSRSDALAIAEVGVARYRELLDRNRILTIYDERLPTGTETPTQTKLWGRTDVCNSNLASFRQGATPQTIADSQDLDNDSNTTESIGSYSLVSYDYINNDTTTADNLKNGVFNLTNDTANRDAIGRLTVKGRASDGSEAQIQVDIPIRINLDDMTNLAPALWIGDVGNITTPTELATVVAKLGDLTIGNGNVVIRDQSSADGCSGFSTLASTTPRRPVISDSRDLPSIQKIITDVASARAAISPTVGSPINTPINSTGQALFGATSHKSFQPYNPDKEVGSDNPVTGIANCLVTNKSCRYYYDLGSTTSSLISPLVDTDLLTDGIARTTLLLNQPLTINATTGIVQIGSTSAISSSDAFEIYVRDNDSDPTNGSTNNITINATGGDVTINGFIHAPQSTLTITGDGTVNINGSIWVGDFVNSDGAIVNISPDMITREPTDDDNSLSGRGYRFYSTTASRTARPITGSPTNWKTEEVN